MPNPFVRGRLESSDSSRQSEVSVDETTLAARTHGSRSGGNLIEPSNFLLATRDSGYKSPTHAVAEFIDNSIQAGALNVHVTVGLDPSARDGMEIVVTDDGVGMDIGTLALCLSFGGSTRFGDRASLGRYGMGLPSAALSFARRAEVYSWQGESVLRTHLDLDEFLASEVGQRLPAVHAVPRPQFVPNTAAGTTVRLLRCDRMMVKRPGTLANRLREDLGRIYRWFLWHGVSIQLNGEPIQPRDPLLVAIDHQPAIASLFGEPLVYKIPTEYGEGAIEVRFAELAVEALHQLPTREKRRLGITGGLCVSVLRANREIDRGWYFMGAKRRENYDDWWRCEVSFDPTLDEHFGITHSKQGIHPIPSLIELLSVDLEAVARALNGRVRRRFEFAKSTDAFRDAEQQAALADPSLPALPSRRNDEMPPGIEFLVREAPYSIGVVEMPVAAPYDIFQHGRSLVLLLNGRHPLYRDLLAPAINSHVAEDRVRGKNLALAILAAARAEASARRVSERSALRTFRNAWGDVLATFIRG